ncbi:MAG: hypothetical protein V1684_01935 [bacterium]
MWLRIIISLIGVAVGALMVIKNEWFLANLGKNAWAEQHLGVEGGSRLMYKLIGLAVILVSLLLMTNLLQGMLLSILSPLFPKR